MNKKQLQPGIISDQRKVFLETLEYITNPPPAIGIENWPIFMRMVGGFRSNEFTILCGATGSGKTAMLASISAELLKAKQKHFVMSVENGRLDYMTRVFSAIVGKDLNTGYAIDKELVARLSSEYFDHLDEDVLYFSHYEDRVKLEQLIIDLQHAHDKYGCKIAFIDNLNFFLEIVRASDALIEMDRVIHELIMFVKRCPIHVVMVMHPKKTDNGRVESEFDIKGSSTAVQEAQNVFLFNRPKQKDIDEGFSHPHDRDLIISKMRRRGKYVGHVLKFKFLNSSYSEKGFT